jgi:signal transduction histidine kinase
VGKACRGACTHEAAPVPDGEFQETPHDLAMLAHELRRRMAALRVVGEAITMLRGRGVDTGDMLDLMVGEVEALDELARELLRDERRGREAARKAGRKADAVAAVRSAARMVATARGVAIRVDAPPAPLVVRANATMLRQAVENLLDNAARHGGAGTVEVAVRPGAGRREVDIVVSDGGAGGVRGTPGGCPGQPGELPQGPSGHGIGLFIVRRFLEACGGRSWVAERPGGGTIVGLSLPLGPAARSVPARPLEAAVNT